MFSLVRGARGTGIVRLVELGTGGVVAVLTVSSVRTSRVLLSFVLILEHLVLVLICEALSFQEVSLLPRLLLLLVFHCLLLLILVALQMVFSPLLVVVLVHRLHVLGLLSHGLILLV